MLRLSIKTLFFISFLIVTAFNGFGQCDQRETITICDITTIDGDGDGTPDGNINLYEEYTRLTGGRTLDPGIWQTSPTNSFALDPNTGEVAVWNLRVSTSESDRDRYTFQLFNITCGDAIPAISINIVLGAFSGIALPTFGVNNVNIEFCDSNGFDLFEGLISSGNVPPPHLNGNWTFISSSNPEVTGVSGTQNQRIEIPYQPGIPLVDQAVLEYRYDVIGNDDCTPSQSTTIRVSIVRQVFSGETEPILICGSSIINGNFDADINLRDDEYLEEEDIEGFWFTPDDPDTLGQIDNELDSNINIREIYDNLVINEGLRFGCKSYEFDYAVLKRSGVCENDTTTVNFTLHEHLRPFQQTGRTPQICAGNPGIQLNLFDLIEFTNEGGIDFIYDNDAYVNWRLVSGDSDLGILTDTRCEFGFIDDIHLGTINTSNALPGTYVFEYGVHPEINCNVNISRLPFIGDSFDPCISSNPCEVLTTQVTVEILPFDYAGDFTLDIELCENLGSVSLRSLLTRTPEDAEIVDTGTWTNETDTVIDDLFVFPNPIDPDLEFTFVYTTIHPTSLCRDQAILRFKIVEEISDPAGEDGIASVCIDDRNIRLFDLLGGTPQPTGTWEGPDGYRSADHIAEFIFNDLNIPRLQEGVYTYTVDNPESCSINDTATVTIEIIQPDVLPIETNAATFCKAQISIDLLSILPPVIARGGTFSDPNTTGALSGSIVTFASLSPATYTFEYSLPTTGICPEPIFTFRITVLDEVVAGSAGEDATIQVCTSELNIRLFDLLGGNPEPTGTWIGPLRYTSTDHIGALTFTDPSIPVALIAGTYTYTVGGGRCSTSTDTANVTIAIVEPINTQENLSLSRCKSDGSLSLFSILDDNIPLSGIFTALDITTVLDEEARFDFSNLPADIYNFQYSVSNQSPCEPSILNIEIKIIDLEVPEVPFSTFCVLDAKRLNDIEVNVLNFNWYPTFESDTPITDNPILEDNTTLYLANVDSENCESERIEVNIDILNIGEKRVIKDENGIILQEVKCPLDLQDGVTPNNDGNNDSFVLIRNDIKGVFNIPEAFPNFELEIYNRFGAVVFEGTRDTEEFRGEGNRSLSIGNQLPSGVYFYLLKPNFKNNAPIQGSFYLSK